jgi:hypothetical protein
MSETAPTAVSKYWRQKRPPRWLPRAALVVAVVWLAVNVSWGIITQLKSILVILLASLFVAFAIEPGVDALARRGVRRGAGTGLVYLGIVLAFVAMAALMGGLIVDQIAQIARSLPDIISSLASFLHDKLHLNIQDELGVTDGQLGLISGLYFAHPEAHYFGVAKVERDRTMDRYHRRFPEFGFDHHRGYGTAVHWEALERYGPTPIHRRSFKGVAVVPVAQAPEASDPSERDPRAVLDATAIQARGPAAGDATWDDGAP